MEPASAIVVLEPVPDADWCAPKACTETDATPVKAVMDSPPATESERSARTARMLSPAVLESGKFCTLKATYVAIDLPPSARAGRREPPSGRQRAGCGSRSEERRVGKEWRCGWRSDQ